MLYIIKQGDIAKAIGKKGFNVKRLENSLKRKLKMVEFNEDAHTFIRKLVFPAKIQEITEEEGVITITAEDLISRGQLIGRDAKHLRFNESIIERYFPIKELKVK